MVKKKNIFTLMLIPIFILGMLSVSCQSANQLDLEDAESLTDADESADPKLATQAFDNSIEFGFPFPVGETWKFSGGPHIYASKVSRVPSSLDFNSNTTGTHTSTSVLAMAPGKVVYHLNRIGNRLTATANPSLDRCGLIIKHSNSSYSLYFHMSKANLLSIGSQVERGQKIGDYRISNYGQCGRATGPHLHVSLLSSPNFSSLIDLNGRYIGGYQIAGRDYSGTLTRGTTTVTADARANISSAWVTNEGLIGEGQNPPTQTFNNAWIVPAILFSF